MKVTKIFAAVAALSMAATPLLAASANPAAPLSLGNASLGDSARVGGSSKKNNDLVGGSLILILIAGAAVVAGVIAATDNGSSN